LISPFLKFSFFFFYRLTTIQLSKYSNVTYQCKTRLKDTRAQFHQHSTYSFTHIDIPNAQKRQSSQQCHLALLGSTSLKAASKTLVKLTPVLSRLDAGKAGLPGVNFINVLIQSF
jgi:hypothetical protein